MTSSTQREPLPRLAAPVPRWSLENGRLPVPAVGALVPASPDADLAGLGPIEAQVRELEHHAADLTARVRSLKAMYFENRRAGNRRQAVDVIEGLDRVRPALDAYAGHCSEILSSHPGTSGPGGIQDAQIWLPSPTELPGRSRNPRVRALFPHPARANPVLQELLGALQGTRWEARTGDEIPDWIVIFDRETAVLPGEAADVVVVVREPATVDYLHRAFERSWSMAVAYRSDGTGEVGDRAGGDGPKAAIIQMLAAGAKDEHIARRLGISVRTCRRHIAEIMGELGAASRFQAGVSALRSGLLASGGGPGELTADLAG